MIARTFAVLFFALSLAACAAPDTLSRQMAGWQDEDIAAAIAAWGEPEERVAAGDEVILVWRDRAYLPPGPTHPRDAAIVCERQLAVTSDGTISGWRWRGNACPSLGSAAERAALVAHTSRSD